jgi:polyisoprenyl-teichoic acid--peptidoglycan teichoic acid transferase
MSRGRALLWTLLGPPLCGLLIAGLITAGWLTAGRPDPLSGETWFRVEQVTGAASYTAVPGQPLFFLVVGNDFRPSGPGGMRGDSIHLIGVNPTLGTATVLGFPRDLAVAIPGSGTDKINAANQIGGLQLTTETVSQLVGVPIPYAVQTDFDGFIAMIDEMGGIDINIPVSMHDPDAGSDFEPGPRHLTGDEALRFSRDRHSLPNGDIGRSENQGLLIISALATLQAQGGPPTRALTLLGILARHAELQGVGFAEFYRFARLAFSLNPAAIRNVVTPTGGGSGSNLSLGAGAQALFEDFRDDATLQLH